MGKDIFNLRFLCYGVQSSGGGVKRRKRVIDYWRRETKLGGHVKQLAYDPYRSTWLAKIGYGDGSYNYIIAAAGLKKNTFIYNKRRQLTLGSALLLGRIVFGTYIYNIELIPGGGGNIFVQPVHTVKF